MADKEGPVADKAESSVAEEGKVRLSLNQVVGGALAAVAAAVAASFLGVYGTIVGAAVMSVVSTAGAVLYEQTIDRSRNRLNSRRHGRDAEGRQHPVRGAWARVRTQLARPRWWKLVGAVSLGVFVIAIGAVTAIEAGIGKPMAAAVTGQHSSGSTSLRVAAGGAEPRPAPSRPGQDGTGERHKDRSSSAPATDQPPPGGAEPDQNTSRPTPGAGSVEGTPRTPAPTEAPEEGDEPLAPTPQST